MQSNIGTAKVMKIKKVGVAPDDILRGPGHPEVESNVAAPRRGRRPCAQFSVFPDLCVPLNMTALRFVATSTPSRDVNDIEKVKIILLLSLSLLGRLAVRSWA